MKTRFLLLGLLLICTITYAQTPEAFKYQAVLKNGSGEIMANTTLALRISVLQDSENGAVVYEEVFHPTTNPHGLVDLEIGNASFHSIDWGGTMYFLKVEVDPDNGSSFTHLGTSPLLSVPYALHARTVELDLVEDGDPDPGNELQTLILNGSDLTISDGNTVTLPGTGGGDNWGTQVVESDGTLSGTGTGGDPLGVVGDLTDNQTLSVLNNDLTISDGNTVTLPSSPWIQTASDIYFSAGNVGINTSTPEQRLHVNGIAQFNLGGGSVSLSTPGGWPGLICFETGSQHRRDIVFREVGMGMLVSTSNSGPGNLDGMWVVPGGNVGIQSYTPGNYPLLVNQRSSYGLAINNYSESELWEFYVYPGGHLSLYRAGGVLRGSFDAASGVYTPVSDRLVKTDIQSMKDALGGLTKLKPSTYKMKGFERDKREIGLLAQDLKRQFPELVFENKDKSGQTILTVNYGGIAVVAVKAIQEQQEIIESQAETIAHLKERLEDLEQRFESIEGGLRRVRQD